MRIAIYHNLPSGGGKRALYEMTRRLSPRHGISVYTLSSADHEFCDLRPYAAEHRVYPFQPLPLARRPFGRLNQAIRAIDLLRLDRLLLSVSAQIDRDGYDLVFVHHCRYSQSPGLLRYLRTPRVYYCHEPPRHLYEPSAPRPYSRLSGLQRAANLFDPLPGLYRKTLGRLDRANVLSASLVLANSRYSREALFRIYGINSRVSPLGVDSEAFQPMDISRENLVVSVGALTPTKGFDWIVRALAEIEPARRPALDLICNAVNPPESNYLHQLASDLGVALTVTSGVSDEELVTAYNRAMMTVYTPIMEPFGFVPLESMACGTPVVGVNEAGVRESVRDGETGILVDRDVDAISAAIEHLLDDGRLREDLGRKARQYVVDHWSWDRSVDILEHHLARAAGMAS